MLPPDGHVHTEWSWDAAAGSMERSCARAVALGLPSIAFTEHADFTGWVVDPGTRARMQPRNAARIGPDGRFRPPPLDAPAYVDQLLRGVLTSSQQAGYHLIVEFYDPTAPDLVAKVQALCASTRLAMDCGGYDRAGLRCRSRAATFPRA